MLEKCFPIFSSSFLCDNSARSPGIASTRIGDHTWGKVTRWVDSELGGQLYGAGDRKTVGPSEPTALLERAQGEGWERLSLPPAPFRNRVGSILSQVIASSSLRSQGMREGWKDTQEQLGAGLTATGSEAS